MTTKTPEQVTRAHEMLEHIERYPDSHDQNWWFYPDEHSGSFNLARVLNTCGTTACAAGWTVLLAGGVFDGQGWVTMSDGSRGLLQNVACNLLGLIDDEFQELFIAAGDRADVRKAVFDIFGPRP